MGLEVFGALLCVGATAVAIVWGVVRLMSSPGSARVEAMEKTLQDLRLRMIRLEKRLGDGAEREAPPRARDQDAQTPTAPETQVRPHAPEVPVAPLPLRRPVPEIPARHQTPEVAVPVPPPHRTHDVPRVEIGQPAAVAAATVNVPPPLPPRPAAPVSVPAPPAKPQVSLESFIGSRVLLVVGVVVALFGIGFFLKYAIDHDLIGPGMRIVLGVVAGLGLLGGGEWLRRRGFDVFGQALMGGGLGALYLSNYFACIRYEFISPTTAFVLTALLTAAGATLAIWRGAPFLAHLGFLGGYLAPLLLGKPTSSLVPLTVWLLVVDAGVLVVLLRRAWAGLDLMAVASTAIYVMAWFAQYRATADLAPSCGCLAALVAASLVLGLVPPILRRVRPTGASLVGVSIAGILGAIGAHDLLFPDHRWALGVGVCALGGAYFLAWRVVASRCEGARAEAESLLGFAAAALASAVAMVASGSAVSPALSAAGAALVFAGVRTGHGTLVGCGLASIGLAVGDVLLFRMPLFDETMRPFLNERFVVFACPCVALLVSGRLLARMPGASSGTAAFVGVAGLLTLPIVLAFDVGTWFPPTDAYGREMRYVAPVTVLAVYGLLAARFFGRGSSTARAFAFVPVFGALVVGLTLCFYGHEREFSLLANPTFGAGLVLVAAAFGSAAASDTGTRNVLRVGALVYLLGLLTAELWSWGEMRALDGLTRERAELIARDWIAITWALFAAAVAGLSALRKLPSMSWLGVGDEGVERGFALLPFAGSVLWGVAIAIEGHSGDFTRFVNLEFAAALATFAACHVVARAPFDGIDRLVRISGYGWLLTAITCELHGAGALRLLQSASRFDVRIDVMVECTFVWAAFAAGIARMDAARRSPGLAWVGLGSDALEHGLALVPLGGAALWDAMLLADGHAKAFVPFLNLEFAAGLAVIAAGVVVAVRHAAAARDVLRVLCALWLLVIVTVEIRQFGAVCPIEQGTRAEAEFRSIVWISIAWAVYAAALVAAGFVRRQAGLRWMGLIVFALTLGKVFLIDMAQLDAVYRIGSFLVLGALLVAASFLYQRSRGEAPRDL